MKTKLATLMMAPLFLFVAVTTAIAEDGLPVPKSLQLAQGLSKADAGRAVDAVIDSISGALQGGSQVSLVGFGTFTVKQRAARQGRNPRTGETIQIKASKVPGFKAGKALKDAVN